MSEQIINSEILWWNPPIEAIEEEISPTVNFLLPQYYLVSSPSLVNEMPGVITDYFIQSPTPFLETIPELDTPSENQTPSPTLSDDNMTSTSSGTSDDQPGRRRTRRRSVLDEAARVARRRERNRLAARRSRNRSRDYYNQLEQRVVELEAEIVRLRGLLGYD